MSHNTNRTRAPGGPNHSESLTVATHARATTRRRTPRRSTRRTAASTRGWTTTSASTCATGWRARSSRTTRCRRVERRASPRGAVRFSSLVFF